MVGGGGVRVPSTGKPRFIMIGIERPAGGMRLYASRDLPGDVGWGQGTAQTGPVNWHVDADMAHVLIIDGATWGECFARAFEIWGNQDREKAIEEHRKAGRITDEEARTVRAMTPRSRVLDGPAHPEQRCSECGRLAGMPTAPCPSCPESPANMKTELTEGDDDG